jgi:hypothetical protein
MASYHSESVISRYEVRGLFLILLEDELRLMAVDDKPDRVTGVATVDSSSSSSGDSDLRFRGVKVPVEEALERCLFSRKERISWSRMDW